MRSQLKRVDGEVAALSQRIKALDENLAKSEQYIKTATAALADAVAMEVERRKNSADNDQDEADDDNPLSQFDAQMALLEGKLLEAKYLASKVTNQSSSQTSTSIKIKDAEETSSAGAASVTKAASGNGTAKQMTLQETEQQPPKLRRPFPVP